MQQRRSDVLEMIAERSLVFGLGGLVSMAIAALLYAFKGDGYTLGLIWALGIGGGVSVILAIYSALDIRKVKTYSVDCPYCEQVNVLTAQPTDDFACVHCSRLVPVVDGKVIPVFQVRCGFCNVLNFYSEKSEALICEECDREIPISTDGEPSRTLPRGFAIKDDPGLYELVLVDPGKKTEEMISVLQQMLALNRAQVKQILADAPVTLLSGITRKKAEILQTQLAVHDGAAEFRPIDTKLPT